MPAAAGLFLLVALGIVPNTKTALMSTECTHPSAQNATAQEELEKLYAGMLLGVNASAWPDAESHEKLWRGLQYASNGRVEARTFAANGPLQVVLFLQQSQVAMRLVEEARAHVFQPFLTELRSGLSAPSLKTMERGVFTPKSDAMHSVMLVFSEHPSLLDAEDRAKWQPVSDEQVQTLDTALRAPLESRCAMAIQLWGYAITPDGSMLLLFEEAPGGSSLLELREDLQRIGEDTLGSLNSRPKKLIHVSTMRLLDWPFDNLTEAESAHVEATIARWAAALADKQLPSGAELPNLGTRVEGSQLELARDTQWMMTHHHTYGVFDLGQVVA